MHAFLYVLPLAIAAESPPALSWAGKGDLRLLVRVDPPKDSAVRAGDERPAEVILDFPALLREIAADRIPDLASVQVVQQDADTGEPIRQARFAYGNGEFDIPWRWYDASLDYEFPEFEGNVDSSDGKINYIHIPRFGYFYGCIGEWRQGHLAFVHRESGEGPSWYGIYFDLLAAGAKPETVEPRGWVGDGLNRCEPSGDSSTGLIHSRLDVADWDGDGLADLIVGCARGGVVWYPNQGRPGEPRFPFSRLMKTNEGMPLDIGWSAAPKVADWDGDGVRDLVVGAEWNRVVWYRNTGTNARPVLKYQGLVCTSNGQPLFLPWEPSPETEKHFKYTRDYYPILEIMDWDGDGDLDLLAGGYVTGRIYLFENTAGKGEMPSLQIAGPIEADGKPLDVAWCAAPAVADLDADGDLDLISGSMPMTAGGGDSSSSEAFLYYFRNEGTRTQPKLHGVPFPRKGEFPNASLATPRLIDWSGDGLLDLVVSAGTNVYLLRNIGTPREPLFEAHADALQGRWGNAQLPATQFMDWNGDDLLDVVNAPNVYLNTGRGSPGVYDKPFSVLAPGQSISHRSGIGDDWVQPRLYDLDADGLVDYMDADHSGHFWWHRNHGTRAKPDFDTKGIQLLLTDGTPVSVGAGLEGFDALQGARATYTVGDFDADGLPDLVGVNTLGMVTYFRQARRSDANEAPRFERAVQIGKLITRGAPYAADWNNDGILDVVVAADADNAFVFAGSGKASEAQFAQARHLVLPRAPYGAGGPVVVADLNSDGDADILLQTAYGYSCLYEHSFIAAGYARGTVVLTERRNPATVPSGSQ